MALRVGSRGLYTEKVAAYDCLREPVKRIMWTVGRVALFQCRGCAMSSDVVRSLDDEQLTQNWSGQGESDCLIKTKHCDGRRQC